MIYNKEQNMGVKYFFAIMYYLIISLIFVKIINGRTFLDS